MATLAAPVAVPEVMLGALQVEAVAGAVMAMLAAPEAEAAGAAAMAKLAAPVAAVAAEKAPRRRGCR